jgi:IS5 family transposase
MNNLLKELVDDDTIKGETLVLDATFIKAWSRRDPADDSHDLSDPEARVGRDGKTYDLGYKAHVAVDVDSDMPVAAVLASAKENEKRHAEELMEKASLVVEGFKAVVADSQYSREKVRGLVEEHGAEPVIPYMSSHRRGEPVLRVDRFFRTSGSAVERRIYGVGRASVERVNSRLELVGLECLRLWGLRNAVVHMLLCVVTVLLVAVAALRLGRPWKARSLSSFWW